MPIGALETFVADKNHAPKVRDLLVYVAKDYMLKQRRSIRTLGYSIAHLDEHLGGRVAAEVTESVLEEYILDRRRQPGRRGQPVAYASIKTELAILHHAYVLAVKRGFPRGAVPNFPTIPERLLTVRQGFMHLEQVQAVCAYLPADFADIVMFCFVTGWRIGEMRRLLWRWIDFGSTPPEIHLPGRDKAGKFRVVPVSGEIAEIIERRKARELGPYVFHCEGRQIGDFRKRFYRACKLASVEPPQEGDWYIMHDMRRSALKRMTEAGIDTKTIMAFSGHLTESSFRRYHIVDTCRMQAAAELLAQQKAAAKPVVPKGPARVGSLVPFNRRNGR